MDVATTTSTTAAAAPKAREKVSDYDTFLIMLTAQIKNQDPLNPMTSDDFAAQLATFSAVEQQTKTNDLLTQQLAQNTTNSMGQLASWVGKEARIAAPLQFDGSTPVVLSPNPARTADKVVLVVKDQSGTEVARTEIANSSADYEWQGRASNGDYLPKGIYNVSLESFQDDKLLGSTAVEYFAKVSEIRSSAGGVTALFPGGVEVSTALITALRLPNG